jgi:hypothetical protein
MKAQPDRYFTLLLRGLALVLALGLGAPGLSAAQAPAIGDPAASPIGTGQTAPAENKENDPDKGMGGTGVTSLPSSRPDPIPQLPETSFGGPGGVGITGGPPEPAPEPPLPPVQSPPVVEPPPVIVPPAPPPAPVEPVRPPETPTPGP